MPRHGTTRRPPSSSWSSSVLGTPVAAGGDHDCLKGQTPAPSGHLRCARDIAQPQAVSTSTALLASQHGARWCNLPRQVANTLL